MKKITAAITGAILCFGSLATAEQKTTIRFGHFPNITHAQGVIAHALSRQGKGWFEQRLGPNVEVQWFTYNAGPSAMEAIFAKSLDVTYVGPGPALNAYFKSNGEEIRVISGAANGGSALLVKADSPIKAPADFRGKKIATPQLGNTQGISCRAWLKANGFKVTQTGGDVTVIPTSNPDQLALFQSGGVDAVAEETHGTVSEGRIDPTRVTAAGRRVVSRPTRGKSWSPGRHGTRPSGPRHRAVARPPRHRAGEPSRLRPRDRRPGRRPAGERRSPPLPRFDRAV